VNLLKPPGMTAQEAVARVRRSLHGERVGHAGTLDPDAAGVLVLAVGRARHLLQWANLSPKAYWGRMALGLGTDTLDADGRVLSRSMPPWPGRADLVRAARILEGTVPQTPPQVSAKRVAGRRAYRAARQGERVWLRPVAVTIASLRVESVDGAFATFSVATSSGAYVRALVRDWAEALGHAAHLTTLVRTRVGPFGIGDAASLEEWERSRSGWDGRWQTVWPHTVVQLDPADRRRVLTGHIPASVPCGGPTALVDGDALLAVADQGRLRRVFNDGWVGR
jgi:tRNA pseudouridine55 synthase